MASPESVRARILALLEQARSAVPSSTLVRPSSTTRSDPPKWHDFEFTVWELGEKIRQALTECTSLRKDVDLQRAFLELAVDRRADRGRQAFIMLLGFKSCADHAPRLVGELDDLDVAGHVVSTLYKMKASGFTAQVRPFANDKRAWIRKEAKRYLEWDAP